LAPPRRVAGVRRERVGGHVRRVGLVQFRSRS
jgi:hypothetical protein